MHCQTTLEQLSELLSIGDSPDTELCSSLREHIQECADCQSRLDALTNQADLAEAARRVIERQRSVAAANDTDSPVLDLALAAVDTLWSDTPVDAPGDTIGEPKLSQVSRLLDPPAQPSDLGSVGRYQVQAVLGRGGMSIVFAAWDRVLERRVAIKVFSTHEDDLTWKRFVREARAAARIEHPAVVPVYEVIERVGKPPSLVMPLLSGGTLQEKIGRQELNPRRAAEITARIADGLAEVHRQGQIHRDIKPGNVLIDDEGQARLSDFSLVRRDEDEPLTEANVLPGTPEFIAPEMLLGTEAAGAASDIYQLGLTLYAMLTGASPYQGSVNNVLRQIMAGPPPNPSKQAAGIPKDLETICLKAIQRQPSSRYPTADELAADLQRFLCGDPIAARRPSLVSRIRRLTKRRPMMTAIVGMVLPSFILLAVGYAAYQQQDQQFQRRAKVFQIQQESRREQLADQTHRADVAELKSEQVLAQTLSAVFAAKQVREPKWADTEKMLLNTLLGGFEQGFEQMRLAPKRNANFGESALSIAKLRCRVDRHAEALETFQLAIDDFNRRLKSNPTDQLWQLQTDALRNYGVACMKLNEIGLAREQLRRACEIAQQQSGLQPDSLKWQLEAVLADTDYGHALFADGEWDQAEAHFGDAAYRVDTIVRADGPLFDMVGFRELFADGISSLARGYRNLTRFDDSIDLQRLAVNQNDRLGNDELHRSRQAESRAALSEILADAGRHSEAVEQLNRALESIEHAMSQSGQPERYKVRRDQWQRRAVAGSRLLPPRGGEGRTP